MTALRNYLATLAVCCAFFSNAQQLPQFTQYVYNTMSINPAYAGSRQTLNATALHRNQWAGIEGNPTTSTLSVHTPIRFSNIGVGLSYINDQLGFEKTNYIYADVSYTVPLSGDVNMALGLKGGVTNYKLGTPDESDPFFFDGFSKWNPNMGAGIYVSSNKWYLGASAPRILNTDLNNGEFVALERNSYYAIGGYVFDIGQTTKFKPTAILKYTNGAPASYDVTANFLFYEKFWIGASYRFNDSDSFGVLMDYAISDSFRIGYAYDLPTITFRPYSGGTHEVILIYELFNRGLKAMKSPRYF
ncbi:type IX secretion system membrane protein PorP/SprF [Zobellia nedashkovskayae]|uniref:PorP/SprF family type IX secretion system membrane protein n=1 Tax=Zobellia nedashkovskayae TaxID=2779510 RepID=UPI00188CDB06|nr:type IX secretion system membrane protein PorP/SprF [Zobellia nedashkovskayae]